MREIAGADVAFKAVFKQYLRAYEHCGAGVSLQSRGIFCRHARDLSLQGARGV